MTTISIFTSVIFWIFLKVFAETVKSWGGIELSIFKYNSFKIFFLAICATSPFSLFLNIALWCYTCAVYRLILDFFSNKLLTFDFCFFYQMLTTIFGRIIPLFYLIYPTKNDQKKIFNRNHCACIKASASYSFKI